MVEVKKAPKFLLYYIGGLILTLGLLAAWIILLVNSSGSEAGDIWLLATLFTLLIGGELTFICAFLRRPQVVLRYDDNIIEIIYSKRKAITIPYLDLTSFGTTKRTLLVMTKANEMRSVRFLANPQAIEAVLKERLNAIIVHQADQYFNNLP